MHTTREMLEFDEFIDDLGLNDLPLAGRKYTWHRSDGTSMSRIDRFLLSDEWLLLWEDLTQWGLERSVSDHCAIMLKSTTKNWGPKPFRTMNCWFDHKESEKLVADKWKDFNIAGWGSFVFKEKLKQLKIVLKEWNKSSFGNLDDKIQAAILEIKLIDDKGECGTFSDADKMKRRELFENFWKLS